MITKVRPPPLVLVLGKDGGLQAPLPLAELERSGFRIADHRGGDDGLEITRTLGPDVVLMDIVPGDPHTLDLCRRLQGDEDTRRIPLIAITGDDSLGQFMITIRIDKCDAVALKAEVARVLTTAT